MPKYFFDLYDGDLLLPDPLGVELPDEEIARTEATKTLSEIAAQEIPADGPRRLFRIVVIDEARTILFEVRIDFYATQTLPDGSPRDTSSSGDPIRRRDDGE